MDKQTIAQVIGTDFVEAAAPHCDHPLSKAHLSRLTLILRWLLVGWLVRLPRTGLGQNQISRRACFCIVEERKRERTNEGLGREQAGKQERDFYLGFTVEYRSVSSSRSSKGRKEGSNEPSLG